MGGTHEMRIPEEELLKPGHLACQGCAASLAMRLALKALGSDTVVVIPACCWSIIAGPFPYAAVSVPVLHMAFETAACSAAAVKAALEMRGKPDTTVLAWAGDGGTFDIGLQSLSGAAERNADIIYICYDNEAYMNTGIQRSSATPWGAWTTTTPGAEFKRENKKDIMRIMAAHGIPYAATASVAHPEDFIAKVQHAKSIRGTKFIHLLSPCPPGWKIASDKTIKLARLATECRIFPLYEIRDGEEYRLTMDPPVRPITEYLSEQGRFKHLGNEAIAGIQHAVNERWAFLQRSIVAASGSTPSS